MAGGSLANPDGVQAGLDEAELGIETGNAVNVVFRDAQIAAEFRNRFAER